MSLQYILFLAAFFAVAIIFQMVAVYIHNNSKKKFESENPDASIMLIKDKQFHPLGFTETLNCLSINGEARPMIGEGFSRGFYLLPGQNVLELQYETQRPGILHKWVRTTYDPQKIEVNVEANKKYQISYSKKVQQFQFEEITK